MNFYRLLCRKILWFSLNKTKKKILKQNKKFVTKQRHSQSRDRHFNMHKVTSSPQNVYDDTQSKLFFSISFSVVIDKTSERENFT